MGLRRMPGMPTRSARITALLSVIGVAVSSGLALGVSGPAAAAQSAAPSVTLRVADADSVRVSGRTLTASARVRFERRSGSGWVFVKRTRAHAHRYVTTLSVAAGTTQTFRATSDHRSRKFVVAMPARTAPAKPLPTLYDDCGARPRKADGSAWSCTFQDDFNGTALDRTKWIPQTVFATGSSDAYACYRDDPSNVNVASGVLNLTVLRLDTPAPCGMNLPPTIYQSGMVSTWHRFSQQYGRFEARLKNTATPSPGLGEGFWMWPDDRVPSTETWPTAGEIDIAETFASAPDVALATLHYSADAYGMQPGVNTNACTAHRGVWNTYTLDWTPTRMEFFVNGKSCLVNTSGDHAFQKAYIIDLTQGVGPTDIGNKPVDGTTFPATLQVDYVHVWK
jgi:beta-glucanase (GH16 family)